MVTILALLLALLELGDLDYQYPNLEYPVQLIGHWGHEGTCWTGMDLDGRHQQPNGGPVPVDPYLWLVGPPPSEKSGVTVPDERWVDLAFRGLLVDGPGPDIVVTEHGKMGEYALLLVGDQVHWAYPLGIIQADDSGGPDASIIEVDLAGIRLPFNPTAIRLVSLSMGGASPGFDIGCMMARVRYPVSPYASHPDPMDGANQIGPMPRISWHGGTDSAGHLVYIGTSPDLQGPPVSLPAHITYLEPNTLQLGTRYYWRVDELDRQDPDTVRTGSVWSFTVASQYVLDDFELPQITGWRVAADSWFAEQTVGNEWPVPAVSGCQSLGLHVRVYHKYHSALARDVNRPLDLLAMGAKVVQLSVKGSQGNPKMARLFVRLADGQASSAVYQNDNPYVLTRPQWYTWRIPLSDFNGIDLSHVTSIEIGAYGQPGEPAWPVEVWFYVDRILVSSQTCDRAQCEPADLDCNCRVDGRDLALMGDGWLSGARRRVPTKEPNAPIAWYRFEGNANDSVGSAHGQLLGDPYYWEGKNGLGLALGTFTAGWSKEDRMRIPNAGQLLAGPSKGLTIAFWQKGQDSTHNIDGLVCSDYKYGISDPAIFISIGAWDRPGRLQWSHGRPMNLANTVYAPHRSVYEWSSRWNHWTFTKDLRTGRMAAFLNGQIVASTPGTPQQPVQIQYLDIGNGWFGYYDGVIDELQLFDYALSEQEAAYLASEGTGLTEVLPEQAADLDADGVVAWADFAILARQWLAHPGEL